MEGIWNQLWEYTINLYKAVPSDIYEGVISIFCIGLVVFVAWKGLRMGLRYTAALLFVEYVFLIFCSTVFLRATSTVKRFDWHPFWSYKAIENGRSELLAENIMNVVVFVPVGILLVFVVNGSRSQNGSWLKVHGSWLIALFVGMGISVSIEVMQYFFHRGFAETDDVMHNTVGCIMGYILVQGSRLMVKGLQRQATKG